MINLDLGLKTWLLQCKSKFGPNITISNLPPINKDRSLFSLNILEMEFYGVLYVPVLTAVIYWLLSFTTLWDQYYISSLQIRTLRQRSKRLTKSVFWWQSWDLNPGRLTSDYTHTHTHTQPLLIRLLISFDKHSINTFRLQLLQLQLGIGINTTQLSLML